MSKKLLVFAFFIVSVLSYAQVFKLRADYLLVRELEDGVWSEWSEELSVDDLLVFNLDKRKITFYIDDGSVKDYDIIKFHELEVKEDKAEILRFGVVDDMGTRCLIALTTKPHEVVKGIVVFVKYRDFEYAYYVASDK
ncbi:hypothetical protein NMK71_10530 [Weeksellaceae bacterium KMM 9713]|uniref:Uncharacterized protein n=1 Tax=Profundicola chukchiensis TaxID=2961959 RepID=A0A9X4MZZ5_9FLAO|nr:hypothetical protein [Profundicola chukchiensis]MDG4946852.1 hypothetical protein [Profundicola chukchiensis]